VLSRNQQLLRLDFEDGFPGFDPAALRNASSPTCRTAMSWCCPIIKRRVARDRGLVSAARTAGKQVLVTQGPRFWPLSGRDPADAQPGRV